MSSDREISIRGSQGEITRVRLNDPMFAEILAPLIDLESDANEVVLHGVVEEVFERQYTNLQRLLTIVSIREDNPSVALVEAKKAHITLDKIREISRLLTLPNGWEVFVGVEPGDSDYYNHLRAMIPSIGIADRMRLRITQQERNTKISSLLARWREKEAGASYPIVHEAMRVALHNAFLVDYHVPGALYGFDWLGLLGLERHMGVETSPEVEEVYLTFEGRGHYDKSGMLPSDIAEFIMATRRYDVHRSVSTLNINYGKPISTYYPVALSSFPDDVDVESFGLGYLIAPERIKKSHIGSPRTVKNAPKNAFSTIVSWVHQNISIIAHDNAKGDPVMEVKLFIDYASEYIMGRKGLVKALLVVLHEIERSSINDKRTERLELIARHLEERLEMPDDSTVLPLNQFPDSVL